MPLASDPCICLRKVEYSETSQILTLFSRQYGIFRAIAKGAHRRTKAGASKFDGGLDLLELGEAVFTHDPARDMAILTEWKLQDGHLELRRLLRATYLGLYAAELVSQLVEEHDPHPELFDCLSATIVDLGTPRGEASFLAFQLDLMRETGYLMELAACAECGRDLAATDTTYFSPARGGVICCNCEGVTPDRVRFDHRLLRLIQSLLRLPRNHGTILRLPQLTRHQTDPINRVFATHIQHTLGKPLRMAKYVVNHGAYAQTMPDDAKINAVGVRNNSSRA